MRRRPMRVPTVPELQIGRERREKLAGRNAHPFGTAQVAEVHLAERVALLVTDTTGRIVAEEHLRRIVDALDPIHQDEVALPSGKDDQLRPPRPGLAAGGS